MVDFAEDRHLEVHELDCHDCIVEVAFLQQYVLDGFGQFPPGHSRHLKPPEDREVYESVIVDHIAHEPLLACTFYDFRTCLIADDREVEHHGEFRVAA